MPEFIPEHTPEKLLSALPAKPEHLEPFMRGYLACAEWLLDEEIDRAKVRGFSMPAIKQAKADCITFLRDCSDLIKTYAESYMPKGGYDVYECAGHDFFLTRNGHGAGFWDRGNDPVFELLSKAARSYGASDTYLHRGRIYFD